MTHEEGQRRYRRGMRRFVLGAVVWLAIALAVGAYGGALSQIAFWLGTLIGLLLGFAVMAGSEQVQSNRS